MKKLFTLLFLSLCLTLTKAQVNLVPNPSFEDTITCPQNYGDMNAKYWYTVESSPGYFNSCNQKQNQFSISVPQNFLSYRNAATGDAYCGTVNYVNWSSNLRDKIGVKLIDTLKIGKKYNLSCKISSVNTWHYQFNNGATNKLGFLFSTQKYDLSHPSPTNNYCHFKADSIIKDTIGWELINGTFIADSAYAYLSIGNFYDDQHTDTLRYYYQQSNPNFPLRAYTFIDDIFVGYDSLQDYIEENKIAEKDIFVYPNPAIDNITIDFNQQQFKTLIISDLLGRQFYFDNQLSNKKKEIDVSHLPNGFYIIQLTSNSNYKFNKKFNIIHN